MTTEITYLVWTALLTALLWIPYILDRFMTRGIADTVGYPTEAKPASPWAARLKAAHENAVEGLVVFAALVLAANAAGISDDATTASAIAYFWARVVHVLAYVFAIPWVRTIAFLVGFGAQICIAWQILA